MHNLATLTEVKAWLPEMTGVTTNDTILGQLLTRVSAVMLGYLGRPSLIRHTVTELLSGSGSGPGVLLKQWPVLSVASVTLDGVVVPASASSRDTGWALQPWDGSLPGSRQLLALRDYSVPRAALSSTIVYDAGYYVTDEAATIPVSPFTVTVAATQGSWAADGGVTRDGAAMTKVTGTPTTGQYALGATPGQYIFALADVGAAVLISYSFIPAPLTLACAEAVAERFKYRARIGLTSQSVGGQETTAYSLADLQPFVKMALQPYRSMVPL